MKKERGRKGGAASNLCTVRKLWPGGESKRQFTLEREGTESGVFGTTNLRTAA